MDVALKLPELFQDQLVQLHDQVVLGVQQVQAVQLLLLLGHYLLVLAHEVVYHKATGYD